MRSTRPLLIELLCFLLLQRFLRLVEQAHVLDGDDGLIGEGAHQLLELGREGAGLGARHADHARATVSLAPPAACGTMIRIGLAGQASCAPADTGISSADNSIAAGNARPAIVLTHPRRRDCLRCLAIPVSRFVLLIGTLT